jgi:hypothetical protein
MASLAAAAMNNAYDRGMAFQAQSTVASVLLGSVMRKPAPMATSMA